MNEIILFLKEIKQLLNDIKTLLEKEKTQGKKKEKRVLEKETVEDVFRAYTEEEALLKSLLDFAESRRMAKSTITVRAANLLLKKLEELGTTTEEKIKMVEQSTMNGWKSIYPLSGKISSVGTVKKTTFNSYYQREEDYDAIEKRALQKRVQQRRE